MNDQADVKKWEMADSICGSCLRIFFVLFVIFFVLLALFLIFMPIMFSMALKDASKNVDGYRLESFNKINTQMTLQLNSLDESFGEIQTRLEALEAHNPSSNE